jgi:hypothetical protein
MKSNTFNAMSDHQVESAMRLINALFECGDKVRLEAGEASVTLSAGDVSALRAFAEQHESEPVRLSAPREKICWVTGWSPQGAQTLQSSIEPTACLTNGEAMLMIYRLEEAVETSAANKKVLTSLDEICERNGAELGDGVPLAELGDWRIVSLNPQRRYSPEALDRSLCVMGDAGPEPLDYSKGSGMICGTGLSVIQDIQNDGPDPELAVTEFSRRKAKVGKLRKLKMSELFEQGCVFRMSKEKDGPAWVFGELAENARQASAVIKVSALALDFDTGVEIDMIDAAVERMGVYALRYTTHSHTKTQTLVPLQAWNNFEPELEEHARAVAYLSQQGKYRDEIAKSAHYDGQVRNKNGLFAAIAHDPVPRCRLVVPLKAPFEPDIYEGDLSKAKSAFSQITAALASDLGLSEHYDQSAVDLARLNYKPAAAPGAHFGARLFSGGFFDWEAVPLKFEDKPGSRDSAKASSGEQAFKQADPSQNGDKLKARTSVTEAGQKLGSWHSLAAEHFKLASVIKAYAPDKMRSVRDGKINMECPFDAQHSDPGNRDDEGFFVADACPQREQAPLYVASCRHNSCQNYTALDMLAKQVADGVIPPAVLCDQASFNNEVDEDELCKALMPALGAGQRLSLIEFAIEKTPSTPDRLAQIALADLFALAELDKPSKDLLLDRLWHEKKVQKKVFRDLIEASVIEQASKVEAGTGQAVLKRIDGSNFELSDSKSRLRADNGWYWIEELEEDHWASRTTAFEVVGDLVLVDEDRRHMLSVNVHGGPSGWKSVDLKAGLLARKQDLMAAYLEAGMKIFDGSGEKYAHMITRRNTSAQRIAYSRCGFRDHPHNDNKLFICPTGAIINGDNAVVLAPHHVLPKGRDGSQLAEWSKAATEVFSETQAVPFKMALLVGLAGPLLGLAEEESLMVSLEGESSTGKSSVQKALAALWASPVSKEALRVDANSTLNALFSALVRGSGTLTTIDEIGKLKATDLSTFVINAPTGSDKMRMRDGQSMQATRRWDPQSILFGAEIGFAQRLLEGEEQVLGGHTARVFPLTFDVEHMVSDDRFACMKALERHSAVAGPAFVKALFDQGWVGDPSRLKARLKAHLERFVPEGSALAKRSLRAAAYGKLAAEIAEEAGLFEPGDVDDMICAAIDSAMNNALAPRRPADRAAEELMSRLVHEKNRLLAAYGDDDNRSFAEIVGYFNCQGSESGFKEAGPYMLRVSQMPRLYPNVAVDPKLVIEALMRRGDLTEPSDDRAVKGKPYIWRGFEGLSRQEHYIVIAKDRVELE